MPSKLFEPLPPSFIIRPAYQTLDGIVPPPTQRMTQPVLALAPFVEPPSEIDLVEGYSENCWDIDPAPVRKYHDIQRTDIFEIPFKENEDEDGEKWDMELLMKNLRGITSQLLLGFLGHGKGWEDFEGFLKNAVVSKDGGLRYRDGEGRWSGRETVGCLEAEGG
ncbi:hypothetical protein NP233_g4159 [Leucocoprinus birnbaumii]|uniref:Uncharacterized protein n=1 Tax=Leucocoprinus birnbaumii TaxID=56174 RepID=A0AAD5VYY0_9AGAR|nr:hypothetical protein NP233_g4159 [Leucocoprinus birnbaumii]